LKKIKIVFVYFLYKLKGYFYLENLIKMKISYFIIILALIILKNSTESIKSDYFCKKVNNENCLKHDCDKELCSVDENSCNHFIVWQNIMKKYLKKDINRTKYNKFMKSIKKCNMIQIDGLNSLDNYCKKAGKNIECEIYSCGEKICDSNGRIDFKNQWSHRLNFG